MAKKSQAINKKVLAIGGGIIVLGLLLVGTYGNSLKTQIGMGGGPAQPSPLNYPDNPDCIAAQNAYNNEIAILQSVCTPIILVPIPQGPSQACLNAMEDLAAASNALNRACNDPGAPSPPTSGENENPRELPSFTPPPVTPPIREEPRGNPIRILPFPEETIL